jgi:hypothetical protein
MKARATSRRAIPRRFPGDLGVALLLAAAIFLPCCSNPKRKPVDKMTQEELLDSLSNGTDDQVRAAVVRRLGAGKDHLAIAVLTVALKDDSEQVRAAAASAMGETGKPEAADLLWTAIGDSPRRPAFQLAAALALAKLGDKRAGQLLVQALPNGYASAALTALGQQAVPPLIAALHDTATRQRAAPVLVSFGPLAVDALIEVARADSNKQARLAAIRVLAEIDDERAAAALNEIMKEPGVEVTLAGYRYLIRSGSVASERRLIETLMTAGRRDMAEDFVSSGNRALKAAGEDWAGKERATLTLSSADREPVFWGGLDPSLKQLALFHFDASLASVTGSAPVETKGASFATGKWGSALSVAKGGTLKYPLNGNLQFDEGSIEMWIAPKLDGTDPIYKQYNHILLLYLSPAGDQFIVSESILGGFYCGSVIGNKFAGAGGGSIAGWKAGTWHHLAFTYSSRNARQRFYLDGVVVSETKGAMPAPRPGAATFTVDCDPWGNWTGFDMDELVISGGEKARDSIQRDAFRKNPL